MENKPEAAVAPEVKTEATPTNTNPEPATAEAPVAPDMHGFTSEQLADMQKFFQANGGYDKVKSRISNPTPASAEEQKPVEPAQPAEQKQPEFKMPEGALGQDELIIQAYFERLAEKKFPTIADEIISGRALDEMNALGIKYILPNGAIDAKKVDAFLTMKAQTVPAKQTSETPEASAAPTVDYVPVGDKIADMNQALQVIRQDSQLRSHGQAGHPSVKLAEDFLRENLNKGKK